jgi:dTMP kinase
MNQRAGLFITLEGGEGAGKSTAARRLAERLQAEGYTVLVTREPGGTPGAEAVRALLLGTAIKLDPLAQTMLHFAARADLVETVIRPALARGDVVICDRFYDSTMAYQAYGLNVDVSAVASLIRLINLTPDLTFIMEVSEDTANNRRAARGGASDRYEEMGAEFMARVAHGFRAIATSEPGRCVLIDAEPPVETVVTAMRQVIRDRTGR